MPHDEGTFRDRYPGPWTIELPHPDTFAITSANGHPLIYLHFRDVPLEWRMGSIWRMSRQEARTLASAIAALGVRGIGSRRRRADPDQLELPF